MLAKPVRPGLHHGEIKPIKPVEHSAEELFRQAQLFGLREDALAQFQQLSLQAQELYLASLWIALDMARREVYGRGQS